MYLLHAAVVLCSGIYSALVLCASTEVTRVNDMLLLDAHRRDGGVNCAQSEPCQVTSQCLLYPPPPVCIRTRYKHDLHV